MHFFCPRTSSSETAYVDVRGDVREAEGDVGETDGQLTLVSLSTSYNLFSLWS